jgi:hypothetical protein
MIQAMYEANGHIGYRDIMERHAVQCGEYIMAS